jgi:hypothetical protein
MTWEQRFGALAEFDGDDDLIGHMRPASASPEPASPPMPGPERQVFAKAKDVGEQRASGGNWPRGRACSVSECADNMHPIDTHYAHW